MPFLMFNKLWKPIFQNLSLTWRNQAPKSVKEMTKLSSLESAAAHKRCTFDSSDERRSLRAPFGNSHRDLHLESKSLISTQKICTFRSSISKGLGLKVKKWVSMICLLLYKTKKLCNNRFGQMNQI